jgi:Transposase DNA-binding/Transposase Tn5 dimerisation domain
MKDIRLKQRLIRLVEQLSHKPTASVPLACGNWAQTKASYRFWNNKKVEIDEIIEAQKLSTLERSKDEEIILAIQDTTDLDFTHHPHTAGLGHLDAKYLRGLKVHSTLAVSKSGVPLGILAQEIWARDPNTLGKKHHRKQKETKDKESQRWLDAERKTLESIQPGQTIITVADREADIFDLFSQVAAGDGEFLIRASHNRCVESELSYLIPTIEAQTIAGYTTVEIGRNPVNAARAARLSIQFMTTEIQSPAGRAKSQSAPPVCVNVILATEVNPPSGVEPIRWLLLTTLAVDSVAAAMICIGYYTLRWLIERYHYTLKSGCQLEQLQLETADRIKRAFVTYSLVAWRLLWLTYQSRLEPDASCECILETDEWQALACHHLGHHQPPVEPPSLGEAVLMLARLGGFLARQGDGVPGVKTIWRGFSRLTDLVAMWRLLHQPPHPT